MEVPVLREATLTMTDRQSRRGIGTLLEDYFSVTTNREKRQPFLNKPIMAT